MTPIEVEEIQRIKPENILKFLDYILFEGSSDQVYVNKLISIQMLLIYIKVIRPI